MDKNSIISQLKRQDIERLRGYRERLDFYHGRQWEGRERRGEKRLTFNYAKVFIDKVTSYLMSGVNFAVGATEDSAEAEEKARRAEAALQQVYEENNLEQMDLETEIDCAILGDAGYAAVEWASYAINRVSLGGTNTPREFLAWGNERLKQFRSELKRLGRRNQIRIRQLYRQ